MQFIAEELGMPVITGPAEGTALGNTLVQLRASEREGLSLAELRRIVRISINTNIYRP